MKKKKKKKKKPELQRIQALTDPLPVAESPGEPEPTPASTPEPPLPIPEPAGPGARRGRRRGGFFWGLGLGFVATLIVIVANDAGWSVLPESNARAETVATGAGGGGAGGVPVVLAGVLPDGGKVYVDGSPATVTEDAAGLRVSVPPGSERLEIRGAQGTWWTTSLARGTTAADTLTPLLGGDVVVELEHQALGGTLYLDGVEQGQAPGSLKDVSPGWHMIAVRNNGALVFEDGCTVKPGEVTIVRVPPVPPRGKGRLVVRSRILEQTGFRESEGDIVIIDGSMVGETPLSTTLDAGFHSIRIEADGHPTRIEVLHLEAGSTRYLNAEFGREERLAVSVAPPMEVTTELPLAIPVRVQSGDQSVLLQEGVLHVVRPGHSTPVSVPLVPSGTDPRLWVGVIPLEVLSPLDELVGYARCTDDLGRTGDSELFRVRLN